MGNFSNYFPIPSSGGGEGIPPVGGLLAIDQDGSFTSDPATNYTITHGGGTFLRTGITVPDSLYPSVPNGSRTTGITTPYSQIVREVVPLEINEITLATEATTTTTVYRKSFMDYDNDRMIYMVLQRFNSTVGPTIQYVDLNTRAVTSVSLTAIEALLPGSQPIQDIISLGKNTGDNAAFGGEPGWAFINGSGVVFTDFDFNIATGFGSSGLVSGANTSNSTNNRGNYVAFSTRAGSRDGVSWVSGDKFLIIVQSGFGGRYIKMSTGQTFAGNYHTSIGDLPSDGANQFAKYPMVDPVDYRVPVDGDNSVLFTSFVYAPTAYRIRRSQTDSTPTTPTTFVTTTFSDSFSFLETTSTGFTSLAGCFGNPTTASAGKLSAYYILNETGADRQLLVEVMGPIYSDGAPLLTYDQTASTAQFPLPSNYYLGYQEAMYANIGPITSIPRAVRKVKGDAYLTAEGAPVPTPDAKDGRSLSLLDNPRNPYLIPLYLRVN
jgi:hypothetical protein